MLVFVVVRVVVFVVRVVVFVCWCWVLLVVGFFCCYGGCYGCYFCVLGLLFLCVGCWVVVVVCIRESRVQGSGRKPRQSNGSPDLAYTIGYSWFCLSLVPVCHTPLRMLYLSSIDLLSFIFYSSPRSALPSLLASATTTSLSGTGVFYPFVRFAHPYLTGPSPH